VRRIVAPMIVAMIMLICGAHASAAVRAWLEPDRITLGESSTLKIEADSTSAQIDYSALEQNFILRGQSSGTQISFVNGQRSMTVQYSVVLEPKEAGVITVPALAVGNESTPALLLTVVPATAGSAASGDSVFIETEISTVNPYVQQAVTMTVRLFYAVPLLDGSIETTPPENASFQQIGTDRRGSREIGGLRYQVFERDLLLLPEKSGELTVPAARFRGQAQINDRTTYFARAQQITAVGKPTVLNVRPRPSGAPTPWLPASRLTLARSALPTTARAGEPLMLELTLSADGATAAQLPALELPAIAGAQVFPEQPQSSDSVVAGQPIATLTRRFAVVPAQAGELRIPAMRVAYWNTRDDKPSTADLDAVIVNVEPGAALPAATAPIAQIAPSVLPTSGDAPQQADPQLLQELRRWQWVSAGLAIALIASLVFALRRGREREPVTAVVDAANAPVSPQALKLALAGENLDRIAAALRGAVLPEVQTLGQLRARIDDRAQALVLDELDRALWAPVVTTEERMALVPRLRSAFRHGVRVRTQAAAGADPLPPLYPPRA